MTILRRLSTGSMAIGLAIVVESVPASFAQDPGVLNNGKSAASAIAADQRQTQNEQYDGPGPDPGEPSGVYIAVPTGSVKVGPEFVEGEPVYARRTTVIEGMIIVEVSTTPFAPDFLSNQGVALVDPPFNKPSEFPAPW